MLSSISHTWIHTGESTRKGKRRIVPLCKLISLPVNAPIFQTGTWLVRPRLASVSSRQQEGEKGGGREKEKKNTKGREEMVGEEEEEEKEERWRTLQEIQIADRSGLRLFRFFTDAYRSSLSLSPLPAPRHSP